MYCHRRKKTLPAALFYEMDSYGSPKVNKKLPLKSLEHPLKSSRVVGTSTERSAGRGKILKQM